MKIVSILIVFLFINSLFAQENTFPPQNLNAPKFKFEAEAFDFGIIEHGSNGMMKLKFTNVGKEPLIISQAQSSCGCLVVSAPKEPIIPGASNYIQIRYDTKRPGKFEKTITITSNADIPHLTMKVRGFVKPPQEPEEPPFPNDYTKKEEDTARIKSKYPLLLMNEKTVDFCTFKKGQKLTKEINFYNAGAKTLLISKVTFTAKSLSAEFPTDSIPSGGSGVIKFSFDSSQYPKEKDLIESVIIHYNNTSAYYNVLCESLKNKEIKLKNQASGKN